ncbi:unnamed protein product, partial [Heligmosomoides polygyrus]|uniref:PET domain-containing protein n=1 Tax=Heligmosomoides polygyrus TaxID=6339 RepID=A0A183FR73_HELPZ
KVCVHCKCDKSEHELPPNQAGSVYERLGIKPPANMPISSSREDTPGSVSHGYAWVPPGLSRKKWYESYAYQSDQPPPSLKKPFDVLGELRSSFSRPLFVHPPE